MPLLLVPLALNAELAARRKLCQWMRGSSLCVTLTADGERHSDVVPHATTTRLCYKCKATFDVAIVAQGPTIPHPQAGSA